MLSYENGGISGNGQESRKRAKFQKGDEDSRGGGVPKEEKDKSNGMKFGPEGGKPEVRVVNYPWVIGEPGKDGELGAARIGGLGIIPIEDQFKASSTSNGVKYVSFHFRNASFQNLVGGKVGIAGPKANDPNFTLQVTVDISPDKVILECDYGFPVIIWVPEACVTKEEIKSL